MPARRTSSSSVALPSSPPSVLRHTGEANSPSEADDVPSPAQTLWTAPSPTQTLGHSSPDLPALPSLSVLGSVPRTPSTVARHEKTDSTYYTASWGSPYRNPPPSFNNRRRHPSTNLGSDDLEEDPSALQFGLEHLLPTPLAEDSLPNQFNLEHLIPRLENQSPVQFNLEHLIPSRLPAGLETPTRPLFDLGTTPRAAESKLESTEEWVQRFLDGRWNRDASDWWSDGTANSETGNSAVEEQPAPVETPAKSHKTHKSNKTLNQQDFWSHFSEDQKEEFSKMMASRYANPDVAHSRQGSGGSLRSALGRSAHAEKPPVSPKETVPQESPEPAESETPSKPQAPVEQAPTPTPAPAPRIRKKVLVKGKGCIISIPRDIPRGSPGFPPKPMSAEDVEQKMQEYERQGYDVRAFAPPDGISDATAKPLSQNRGIWPDDVEIRADRSNGTRVRVPRKEEWNEYVAHLMEAKLAALGVSLGGEEEERPSPMSRQASSQHPGMPFSPPLPTMSAGSHRMRQGSIVSGASFPLGPSPGHMSRQSVASPASFVNPRAPLHMHRHSTFSPASFIQQTASPTGAWSPGNYFSAQGPRGGSPALPLSRPDLSHVVTPGSPFGMRPGAQYPFTPTEKDDLLVQMQQQQQQLQAQLLHQQQQQLLAVRPSSTLAEVPEDEAEEDEVPALKHAAQPGPDIAVPTPRGHRHNISANLEREARDAEYHLEQAIDKQFDEGGDFSTEPELSRQPKPSNLVTDSKWEGSRPVLHQPQPHNRAHSLAKPQSNLFKFSTSPSENPRGNSDGAKTNGSNGTNPSLEDGEIAEDEETRETAQSSAHSKAASQISNTGKDPKFAFVKPGSAMHSKHTSHVSISRLNVEAKEFKFNPSASFSPNSGSFSSSFSFPSALKSPGQDAIPRSNQPSLDGSTNFNVTAPTFKSDVPAFKPTVPSFKPFGEASVFKSALGAPEFKPASTHEDAKPSSAFNFASNGPAFKLGTSVFSSRSAVQKPAASSSSFGKVKAKRSKAVPIVRPDTTRQQTPEHAYEQEEIEDEEGRPMRSEGREKRARRGTEDGDEVPRFALRPTLSQALGETHQPQASKQDPQVERDAAPEDKENLSPNAERAPSKSKSPESPALRREDPAFESTAQDTELEQGIESQSDSRTPIDDLSPHESDAATPTVEEGPQPFTKKHSNRSSLSAAAKPFEFRPQFSTAGYDFGLHVTKPSVAQSEDVDNSPPRHLSRSPATTFRPSDDGSYKTALESGRHATYPESESIDFDNLGQASFNDIDAVLKHMNEEGSDFGVERDDQSWEQSSPRRTPHPFDRNDLPPNAKLRSDAPSPSPRRLYAPRSMVPSSTSIAQDPFDDERAGLTYESPVHRLNNADDVPVSDWDEGLLSEGEHKIQTRSRFFDSHVDELIGGLLQNRLGPVEENLRHIQDSLAMMSQRNGRGRRSMSSERLDSDADDEDDDNGADSHYRNRSPRKDRKLEMIRSIVTDALESHQPKDSSLPVPVAEPVLPEKIRDVVIEALAAQQSQTAPVEQLQAANIREIILEALASQRPVVAESAVEHIKPDDIRSIITEVLATHAPQAAAPAVESLQPDDIRTIMMEAFATHAPPPPPAPIPEQIWPDDLRSITLRAIVTELLESRLPTAPAMPTIQPDDIRSIVEQALATHKPASKLEAPVDIPQPQVDMSELYQIIGSLKASIAQTTSHHLQAEDVRELIDDAFRRQSMEAAKRDETQTIQERDARIADLDAMLKEAASRADTEMEARKVLEAREADNARLLKVTEEELALLQQSSSDDEIKIRALEEQCEVSRRSLDNFHDDDDELHSKLAALQAENEALKLSGVALESSEEDLRKKLDGVSAENEALTFTLEEHRLSAKKWRSDIQQAHEETAKMRKSIDHSRLQTEEATRVREAMRAKFEKLQQDMIVASGQAAAERVQWQKSDEAHLKKYEVLSARIEAEGRTRERLERELERLETQEREGMKLRITLEQTQKHNARLEDVVEQTKQESSEHQRAAERYEREFREARDAAHVEIRRARVLMDADIDTANNQVNIVRADLESEVARVRAELDNVRLNADTAKEKHLLELEAAADTSKHAVGQALEKSRIALQEQQQAFERRLEAISQDNSRALSIAREDKERAEAYHKDRLTLAELKMDHLQDKVSLLEEKLSVAKEAATAAVAAAQSSKMPTPANSSYASGGSDKISPQALRESIAVLQEQLQERESRIETLEQQLAGADNDAPGKLKERDTEISWLRELLGVRIDDLGDLINALAQPSFDRETVRDAAIRIRTNLQMEQQEKERLVQGGQTFPTLTTLSNFASPKAVQLAAAFGNWRSKGRDNASAALAGTNPSSTTTSRTNTPSRPTSHSAQSFLSGLMTPPTSNLRRTPDLPSSGGGGARPLNTVRSNSNSSRGSTTTAAGFPSLGKQPVPIPSTPPLMRKASYDQDAELERFSESGFYDDESTVDGDVTPIGLHFGQELQR
ncbi:hypothetical protein BDV95DRAFT_497435 [Massariosphaeria phaeospora]|uniref:Myosin class II heavy chain n=1 Tax=Massariosphaeria phaeospora TaxID=100035 RepID=A0A7C8MCC5_9PLEO|nr:hypothetical protein BDV95DRAFT_497435 [Massariosphaeria phaeospora]